MRAFYENQTERIRMSHGSVGQFPAHLHGELELLYVERGQAGVTVDFESRMLGPGELAVIFPNQIHSYFLPEGEPERETSMVIFSPELLGNYRSTSMRGYPETPFFDVRDNADILYAMKALGRCPAPGEEVCSALMQLILAHLLKDTKLLENEDRNHFDLTYRLVNLLSHRFREPLTLEIAARELGVSRFTVSRIFSRKLGESFPDYLGRLRVDYAQGLLRTTDLSVTQIAFESGFDNPRSFGRMFLRVTGTSPREYRRMVCG